MNPHGEDVISVMLDLYSLRKVDTVTLSAEILCDNKDVRVPHR